MNQGWSEIRGFSEPRETPTNGEALYISCSRPTDQAVILRQYLCTASLAFSLAERLLAEG